MRPRLLMLILVLGLLGSTLPAAALPAPVDGPVAEVAAAAGLDVCDDTDAAHCLFPFPNDHFSVADDTMVTGRRIDISPLVTPQNVVGRPIDTTEQNRNDGFSPGQLAMTFVPGLDLATTWRTALEDPDAAAATELDLARSLHPDAPIVVVNAAPASATPTSTSSTPTPTPATTSVCC